MWLNICKYGGFSLSSFVYYILKQFKDRMLHNYNMFKRIVGNNIINRFKHTSTKPTGTKTIEDILCEQNRYLKTISEALEFQVILIGSMTIVIAFKPLDI